MRNVACEMRKCVAPRLFRIPHSAFRIRHGFAQVAPKLGPKLRGKIHISVGEADNYYLNNAVHMLDEFLKKANPPADATIVYGPGRGHC